MATHASTLPWRIPRTEGSVGIESMGVTESDATEQLTLSLFNILWSPGRHLAVLEDII